MKLLKEIWRLMGDEQGSLQIIAVACIPLTVYAMIFFDDVPALNALQVILNMFLLWLAFLTKPDDKEGEKK